MNIRVKFLGAAGEVTGSKYLLQIDEFNLLLDCGLFQGRKQLQNLNWSEFPIDPASIDAVVLTHAHLDHTGYLPRLFRQGYRGPVYCTTATADLMNLILMDSASETAMCLGRTYLVGEDGAEPLNLPDLDLALR